MSRKSGLHPNGRAVFVAAGLWARLQIAADRQEGGALASPSPDEPEALIPTSAVLQRLLGEVHADYFTLGWLMGSLRKRAFGVIMVLLAVIALAPGLSILAGLLLLVPAFQMILGRPVPVFPRRIAAHRLPTPHLAALVRRAVPVLRYLETWVHPRWPTPLQATKRLVGLVIVVLSLVMVVTPIPLSNVVPALVIGLMALAYLEEDGVLLAIALAGALVTLLVAAIAVWQAVLGLRWLGGG